MTKKMLKAIERLAVEAVDHLPDSREARLEMLRDVVDALPQASIVRERAQVMIALMNNLDQQQRELVLDFRAQQQQQKNGNGNGQ